VISKWYNSIPSKFETNLFQIICYLSIALAVLIFLSLVLSIGAGSADGAVLLISLPILIWAYYYASGAFLMLEGEESGLKRYLISFFVFYIIRIFYLLSLIPRQDGPLSIIKMLGFEVLVIVICYLFVVFMRKNSKHIKKDSNTLIRKIKNHLSGNHKGENPI
jgi:hypothetical protein